MDFCFNKKGFTICKSISAYYISSIFRRYIWWRTRKCLSNPTTPFPGRPADFRKANQNTYLNRYLLFKNKNNNNRKRAQNCPPFITSDTGHGCRFPSARLAGVVLFFFPFAFSRTFFFFFSKKHPQPLGYHLT